MLPGKDGITICREVRQFSMVPIVMVTARVDEIDRLLGLELGADDYICKPFSPREVVVRVRNLLRRADAAQAVINDDSAEVIEYEHLILNKEKQSVFYNGIAVTLTSVEFRMVCVMAKRPGTIFDRDQLIDAAYSDRRVVSDRSIDTHVKNIRKKIQDVSAQELIHSVYGRGYKIE
jgi:two-component system response regulator BaeR